MSKPKDIEAMLQELLDREPSAGSARNIVFWYDDEREYESEVDSFSLDNAKLLRLTSKNRFKVKYLLEHEDRDSNFVVYATEGKPEPRENWLLDIQKYAIEFSSDRAFNEMRKLGIENGKLKPVFKRYLKAFSGTRGEKLSDRIKAYKLKISEPFETEVAILSAIAKLKSPDIGELLRKIFSEMARGKSKTLESIEKLGDSESFERLLIDLFGYGEKAFSFDQLKARLLYTDFIHFFKGKPHKGLEDLKLGNVNNAIVFVDAFLSHGDYGDAAWEICGAYQEKLKIPELLTACDTTDFIECEAFPVIEEILIQRISGNLLDGVNEFERYERFIKERRSKKWFARYEREYSALGHAIALLKGTARLKGAIKSAGKAADLWKLYEESLYGLDYHYRKFYRDFDQASRRELMGNLDDLIENTYTNGFSEELNLIWSQLLEEKEAMGRLKKDACLQSGFYHDNVRKLIEDKERVFVIISDAMRYEIGSELADILTRERRAEVELSSMVGILPSYTKYGMAALLPHKRLMLGDGNALYVDGIDSVSTINRQSILENYEPDSLAVRYRDIMHYKKEDYRALMTGKRLIYIYHDTIDAAGHDRDPFEAADKALDELSMVVKALVNNLSATRIFITADHGFIYQRSDLADYDKLSKIKNEKVIESERRYIFTTEETMDGKTMVFPLDDAIESEKDVKVLVPRGTIRFKVRGSEGNFTHGGASLQEMVVPLITYRDRRDNEYKARKVELRLTSANRRITNRIAHFDFFQTEPVGDKRLGATFRIYIADKDGNRVSNENIVIADSASKDTSGRMHREKFVLKDQAYDRSETYYLITEYDGETIAPEIERAAVAIDLLISGIEF